MSLEKRLGRMASSLKKGKAVKKRAPKAVRNIEDETPIMPLAVADSVIDEVIGHLDEHGLPEEAERLYNRRDALARMLEKKANTVYRYNERWRKQIKASGNKGLDHLYTFMRHWLTADLRENQYAAFRTLPDSFAMGEEIR